MYPAVKICFFKLILSCYLLGLTIFSNTLKAQTCIYPWSGEIGVGLSEYSGKMGNGFFQMDIAPHEVWDHLGNFSVNRPGIVYLALNKGINPNLDFSFRIYHGEWGYYKASEEGSYFFHCVDAFEFTPRWKFLGNYLRYFTPYLTMGAGVRRIKMSPNEQHSGLSGIDANGFYELNLDRK